MRSTPSLVYRSRGIAQTRLVRVDREDARVAVEQVADEAHVLQYQQPVAGCDKARGRLLRLALEAAHVHRLCARHVPKGLFRLGQN